MRQPHTVSTLYNDLLDNIQSNVRLFADATAVYLAVQGQVDTDIIQNDLILQEWETAWDPSDFNPSKVQVVHISRSCRPIKNKYTIHGQALDSIDHARYLDVDISSDLNFSHHVNCIAAKGLLTLPPPFMGKSGPDVFLIFQCSGTCPTPAQGDILVSD